MANDMNQSEVEIQCIFFVPVAVADIERVAWTIASIRKFCKNYKIYLLLDGPRIFDLNEIILGADVVLKENLTPTKKHWGKIWHMQCQAMVDACISEKTSEDAIFVKIDADALLVRPGFIDRARDIFKTRPNAGQLGQCHTNVLGGRLGNPGWANFFKTIIGWRGFIRLIKTSLKEERKFIDAFRAFKTLRKIITCARNNGYVDGEFAIGGCYILRKSFVQKLYESKLINSSPFLWLPEAGEDGVMTPHVYALGYSAIDDCADGGIFAVEGKEFRIDPFTLKKRGHYVIHPVKYGYHQNGQSFTESALTEKLISDQ